MRRRWCRQRGGSEPHSRGGRWGEKASSYMQKGWKSCSPCGMCLKTRFFSWKVEFFLPYHKIWSHTFFSGQLSPLRTGAWTKDCRIGPECLNSSSWDTCGRVQPQSWYNFQRNISFLVLSNVSSSWLIVDSEIAALKRALGLKPGSVVAASGVLSSVNFSCCSDRTGSVFCYGSSSLPLYEGKQWNDDVWKGWNMVSEEK